MAETETGVRLERDGAVATIVFDRPHAKNAFTVASWRALLDAVEDVERDPGVRAVVLTGEGGDFSSGADVTSDPMEEFDSSLAYMRFIGDVAIAVLRMRKPTIAKVDGWAVGGGLNLALACDLVVASERARFLAVFTGRGLSPDLAGTWTLPRLIGMHRAKQVLLLNEILTAQDAAAMGFVNKVVPVDELDSAVDTWAARLAAGAPIAIGLTKALLADALSVTPEQAVEHEARAQVVNLAADDSREAAAAFREKRPPAFRGR